MFDRSEDLNSSLLFFLSTDDSCRLLNGLVDTFNEHPVTRGDFVHLHFISSLEYEEATHFLYRHIFLIV